MSSPSGSDEYMNPVTTRWILFRLHVQRLMVHNILESPRSNFNFKEFARELQLGAEASERLIDEVRTRVVRQMAERSGQFIAAPQTIELPWWAALGIDPS